MFSDPYRHVKHFGLWAEESADRFGRRDALAVLRDAVDRCIEEDMRTAEVFAALEYLRGFAFRPWLFEQFRSALDIERPDERRRLLGASVKAVERSMKGA